MTPSNDVLVSDALLEDTFVTIWPDYPCLYDVRSVDLRNRDFLQKVMEAIGGATGSDIYFENIMQVPICIYLDYRFDTCQMELRELKTFSNIIS